MLSFGPNLQASPMQFFEGFSMNRRVKLINLEICIGKVVAILKDFSMNRRVKWRYPAYFVSVSIFAVQRIRWTEKWNTQLWQKVSYAVKNSQSSFQWTEEWDSTRFKRKNSRWSMWKNCERQKKVEKPLIQNTSEAKLNQGMNQCICPKFFIFV